MGHCTPLAKEVSLHGDDLNSLVSNLPLLIYHMTDPGFYRLQEGDSTTIIICHIK